MSSVIKSVGILGEVMKKRARVYRDLWTRRINYVVSQLITARLALGKAHEGEAGLLIVKFVKETFRTFSMVMKLDKLLKTDLGRSYIVKTILDNVNNDEEGTILSKLINLRNLEGVYLIRMINYVR